MNALTASKELTLLYRMQNESFPTFTYSHFLAPTASLSFHPLSPKEWMNRLNSHLSTKIDMMRFSGPCLAQCFSINCSERRAKGSGRAIIIYRKTLMWGQAPLLKPSCSTSMKHFTLLEEDRALASRTDRQQRKGRKAKALARLSALSMISIVLLKSHKESRIH